MAIDKQNSRFQYLKKNNSKDTGASVGTAGSSFQENYQERALNMQRLMRYRAMWDAMSSFRQRRQRNKLYYHGDQWVDKVEVQKLLPNGQPSSQTEWVSEAENIRRQGKVPLKNNVISSTVSSILGVFRQNYGKPEVIARVRDNQRIGEMNTVLMEYIYQINSMKEIDAKDLLEAMIGGLAVQTTDFQWNRASRRNEESAVSVNPSRVFLNGGIEDPRGGDITCIGVLLDMSVDEAVQRYAKTKEQAARIRDIYKHCDKDIISQTYATFVRSTSWNTDFFVPNKDGVCRVIQAWEQESEECWLVHDHYAGTLELYPMSDGRAIDQMIQEREQDIELNGLDYEQCKIEKEYFNDIYWQVRYLSPFGDVLYEARTPFAHEQHPFAVYMGHLIDGEIHSFVEQILDQQRYINRLITLIDFIMGASAKGVLVFPENSIPKGMNKEDILEQWRAYNGVIFANLKPGQALPQQIAHNATNIGAQELLSLQLQLIRDISGVHGALQGKEAKSGTAASLYAQEASNAQVNIMDLLESFTAFRQQRDYKLVKIAPQCYDEEFYVNLAGRDYDEEAKMWRPDIAAKADVYINLEENNNTATYRMMANQILIKAMEMRLVDFETVLDAGGIPNADKIRGAIERRKEELKKEQEEMQKQQAQQQAMAMQGQAAGQQMAEAGVPQGQIMQMGADLARQAVSDEEPAAPAQTGNEGSADAMSLIQQALG